MSEINLQELKVIVSAAAIDGIRRWTSERLTPVDPYRVTTIYLDNPELDLLNGLYDRSDMTYRARRYGEQSSVWLERKRRLGTAVSKRRAPWQLSDLDSMFAGRVPERGHPTEFFRAEVIRGRLAPRTVVSFDRQAWTSDELRMTLDTAVCAAIAAGAPFQGPAPATQVIPGAAVLELKTESEVRPALMELLMNDLGLTWEEFSKYSASARALTLSAGQGERESTA